MKLFRYASFLLLFCASTSFAQSLPVETLNRFGLYDKDRLPPSFHAGRRQLVLDSMQSRSIALFTSATKKNRANDVDYEYHQDPNFYYLTGQLEDNSALLLLKEPVMLDSLSTREILFVQRRNPAQETWSGRRIGVAGGREILGFSHVYPIDSLPEVLAAVTRDRTKLYYTPTYTRLIDEPLLDHRFAMQDATDSLLKIKYPELTRGTLDRVMASLRMIKTFDELNLMGQAIRITTEAHNEIMRQVKPGWREYEIQALGEYIFSKNGAEYPGYPCIVGSGENSVILHYNTNRRQTKDGDVVEMDIGAEYHGYTADVTRSYPVNGKFTTEQRIIYDLVLEAQDSGIAHCQVGEDFKAPHRAAVEVISRGLVKLGIIKTPEDYRTSFMHGTSHYLGLDVHDAGTGGPLQPYTVITVEPGIYIKAGSDCDPKWWNIGLRIEDDILITSDGPANMSAASPRTADEVEQLMRDGNFVRTQ